MMNKIKDLPEPVRQSFYRELNVDRIISELRKPANLVVGKKLHIIKDNGKKIWLEVPIFCPTKSIFGFTFMEYDNPMKPTENVKTKEIRLDYDECLQLISEQYAAWHIVKERGLDIGWFKRMFREGMTYEDYADANRYDNGRNHYYLTKEEFELIREALL